MCNPRVHCNAVTVLMFYVTYCALCRCESLKHATTGDHVTAVTADFQEYIEDRIVSQIIRQCTLAATAALTPA